MPTRRLCSSRTGEERSPTPARGWPSALGLTSSSHRLPAAPCSPDNARCRPGATSLILPPHPQRGKHRLIEPLRGPIAGARYTLYVNNVASSAGTSIAPDSSKTFAFSNLTIAVDALADNHPINPLVYGVAWAPSTDALIESGATVHRWGGNHTSTYNWSADARNVGNDWYFENSAWSDSGDDAVAFANRNTGAGAASLLTVPALPYVAKNTTANSFSGANLKSILTEPDASGDTVIFPAYSATFLRFAAADTDGDTLPGFWEQTYFGSVTGTAPDGDPDGDGFTNAQEHRAGTIPTDPESALRITGVTRGVSTACGCSPDPALRASARSLPDFCNSTPESAVLGHGVVVRR